MARICAPLPLSLRKTNLARLLARRPFSRSLGTGALRRDRARERGGRAAAWSTIYADNPTPSPFRHDSDVNQAFASSVIVGSPNGRFAPEAVAPVKSVFTPEQLRGGELLGRRLVSETERSTGGAGHLVLSGAMGLGARANGTLPAVAVIPLKGLDHAKSRLGARYAGSSSHTASDSWAVM